MEVDFSANNQFYQKFMVDHPRLRDDLEVYTVNKLSWALGKSWERIGINLSGGADSAAMALILCRLIKEHALPIKIDAISYIRCWHNRPWQPYISEYVFKRLRRLFPDVIGDRHTCFIPPDLEHGKIGEIVDGRSGDQIIVGSFNFYAAFTYKLDAVFNATSKNPNPESIGELVSNRMTTRDMPAEQGKVEDVIMWTPSTKSYTMHPFRFVEKDYILAQFKIFDAWDLFEATRSCEGDILNQPEIYKGYNIFEGYKWSPDQPIPECKQCFWCKERDWAKMKCEEVVEALGNE